MVLVPPQIRKVDLVQPLSGGDGGASGQGSGAGVIAAIAISCVAAACLLVLAALLVSAPPTHLPHISLCTYAVLS